MALTRKWMPSPNYSVRGQTPVRLIVLHTAEGALTIESLGSFFSRPRADVSSHVGIDDKPNVIGEYVKRGNKAWTAAAFNPVAVQAELCGFAKWSTDVWKNQHPQMLRNCAQWIAEEAAHFGLPIVELTPSQAQGSGRGVCQHRDLGAAGGGHFDCGDGFPMDYVLDLAKKGTSSESGSGEDDDELGYPQWFWNWNQWYINTSRDPAEKPEGVPHDIPDWAWDGQRRILNISRKYGMTQDERDWISWYNDGKQGPRPDVPQDIPDHWWKDQAFDNERSS